MYGMMVVPSAWNFLGKLGTSVLGTTPALNQVVSIRAYIFFDITAPAHQLNELIEDTEDT